MLETSDIFNILHNAVEAKNNGKKISHAAIGAEIRRVGADVSGLALGHDQAAGRDRDMPDVVRAR